MSSDPSFAPAHFRLGSLLIELGRTDEAIAALGKATELDPELSEASYALGNELSRVGRTEEAQIHLQRFKELQDQQGERRARQKRAGAAMVTGLEHLKGNRLEDAIGAFREVIELDPESDPGYAYLAKIHRSLGELDVAIPYIRQAMELDPALSEYPYVLLCAFATGAISTVL